jgi:membrane-associated phospholipid phosphatase
VKRWWLAGGLLAVTLMLNLPPVRAMDLAARDVSDAHRPQLAYDIVVNINRLGSGGALTAIAAAIAVVLAWRRRTPRPVLLVVAAFALTVVTTELFKWIVDRPAPHAVTGGGVSYPSGHAVNSIVWYAVLCALLAPPPRLRALIRWAPPVILAGTTAYLGFHWVTDVVAGLLLGLLIEQAIPQTLMTSTPAALNGAKSASPASSSVMRV